MLIVACNTMAAVARKAIVELSPVPVLDVIDAGARTAAAVTRTKRVGVIGTPATINSGPEPWPTASRCWGFSVASTCSTACFGATSMTAEIGSGQLDILIVSLRSPRVDGGRVRGAEPENAPGQRTTRKG